MSKNYVEKVSDFNISHPLIHRIAKCEDATRIATARNVSKPLWNRTRSFG